MRAPTARRVAGKADGRQRDGWREREVGGLQGRVVSERAGDEVGSQSARRTDNQAVGLLVIWAAGEAVAGDGLRNTIVNKNSLLSRHCLKNH